MATGNQAVTINVTANASGVNASLNAVNKNLGGLGSAAATAGASMGALGGTMSSIVGQITGVAAAFLSLRAAASGIAEMVKMNAQFEDTMQVVKAVTEQNAGFTIQSFKEMGAEARRLGGTTRFSASEAADGLKYLAMAGFTAEQAMTSLEATLKLAQGGNMDLGMAADIASNIMTSFGMKAEEMGRITDVLARTAAMANTDVEQLGDGMKYVAPLAAGLGRDIEETSAAMAVLSNAGLQASMAGTGLRMILMGLGDENSKAIKTIRGLGLSFEQVNPATNSLAVIMQRLKAAGFGAMDAMAAFGARGGPAGTIMVNNAEAVGKFDTALRAASGSANIMAATMDDSLIGSFKNLQSAWDEMVHQLMEGGVWDALREISDSIEGLFRDIGNSKSMQGFGQSLGNGIAVSIDAMKSLASAFSALVPSINTVMSILKTLSILWVANKMVAVGSLVATRLAAVSTAASMVTMGVSLKTLRNDFNMFKTLGLSTFASIRASAQMAFMGISVSAQGAALKVRAAALVMKMAFIAALVLAEQLADVLVRIALGGHNAASAMAMLAGAQDALNTQRNTADFLDDYKQKIKDINSSDGLAESNKTIDKQIKEMERKLQDARIELPERPDRDYDAIVPTLTGKANIAEYEAALEPVNALRRSIDELNAAKDRMNSLPLKDGGGFMDMEESIKSLDTTKKAIEALSLAKQAADKNGGGDPAINKALRFYQGQLYNLQQSAPLMIEAAKREAEISKEKEKQVQKSQEDLNLKQELLEKTKELVDQARTDSQEKWVTAQPDEMQVPSRLRLVGLDSTSQLNAELAALGEKGSKTNLSEVELERYELLLDTYDKIYSVQERLKKSAEDKAKKEREAAADRSQISDELDIQVRINNAKAAGDKERVASLEKQRDIEQKTLELIEKGFDATVARNKATALVESDIAAAKAEDNDKAIQDRPDLGLAVDSMQAQGGGGNFGGASYDPIKVAAEDTAKTNREIAANTAVIAGRTPAVLTPDIGMQRDGTMSLKTPAPADSTPKIGSAVSSLESVSLLKGILDVLKQISKSPSTGGVLRVRTSY